MAEMASGSRSWLCNSERLQGGREPKYVQFQKELRGTWSARESTLDGHLLSTQSASWAKFTGCC